jgi:hypothetical protein
MINIYDKGKIEEFRHLLNNNISTIQIVNDKIICGNNEGISIFALND